MVEIQRYNCREKGETYWREVEATGPEDAAACYAQDRGYDDIVIEVEGHALFRVTSHTEWNAERVVEKTNLEIVDELIEKAKANPNCGRVTQEHLDRSAAFVEQIVDDAERDPSPICDAGGLQDGVNPVFDPERIWNRFRVLLPIQYHGHAPVWTELPEPIQRAFAEVIGDMERWFRQFLSYYGLEKLLEEQEKEKDK